MSMMPGHHDNCRCETCEWARYEQRFFTANPPQSRPAPIQEMDGHFRGCPRLGKCRCPTNAPRDEWRPDDAP